MSAHKKRTALAVLERRKNVAARYVRGQTQWEIARAFEVDQGTISRDLKAIHAEWLASAVLSRGEWTARELARIDEVERQAWAAWAKSQENAETLRAKMRGDKAETEKISKGQAGDPRYLEIVLKCIAARIALLAPANRTELLGMENVKSLSDDERAAAIRSVLSRVGGADPRPPADEARDSA